MGWDAAHSAQEEEHAKSDGYYTVEDESYDGRPVGLFRQPEDGKDKAGDAGKAARHQSQDS